MKTIKKYAYLSPETEILSLETTCILLEVSDTTEVNLDDPNKPGGGLHAPWRY